MKEIIKILILSKIFISHPIFQTLSNPWDYSTNPGHVVPPNHVELDCFVSVKTGFCVYPPLLVSGLLS